MPLAVSAAKGATTKQSRTGEETPWAFDGHINWNANLKTPAKRELRNPEKSAAYEEFALNEYRGEFAYNELIATTARVNISSFITEQNAKSPPEVEVVLREELAAQLANASAEIEAQLIILRASGSSLLGQAQGALDALGQLQRQVSHADIRALANLRGTVSSYVASALATVQQATAAHSQISAQALEEARENARSATTSFMRDYFENRKFDQYLQFASRQDEEKYRQNEEVRRREIEKAQAEGTATGDLRANRLAIEQLKDAGAHGADKSPDYKNALGQLQKSEADLQKAVEGGESKSTDLDPSILAAFKSSVSASDDSLGSGHGLSGAAVNSQGHAR